MAIAFTVLMAWPTSASAQFLAPGPAAKAMKSQKATTDIRKKDAKASKFKAMPLPRQAKQSSIGIQKQTLLQTRVRKATTAPVIPLFGASPFTVGGTEIWGMKVYDSSLGQDDVDGLGLVSFNTSSPSQESPIFMGFPYLYYGAAIKDGKLYGMYMDDSYTPYLLTIDTESWEVETVEELSDYSMIAINDVAADASGVAYGVFYNADASDFNFSAVDYSTKTVTTIAPAKHQYIASGITADHVFYGVAADETNTDVNLYKVDVATGEETLVGPTGLSAATFYNSNGGFYLQSGVADSKTNTLYWHALTQSITSVLYAIDLTSAQASLVYQFPNVEEFTELLLPPVVEASKAPGKPSNFTVAFDGLHNYFIFTAPTQTASGEDLGKDSGMGYVVMSNGVEVTRGLVGAGETKRTVIELPDGLQNVEVFCENAWGKGPKATSMIWVGYDVPIAPQNVKASYDEKTGKVTVEWDPVTVGAHNTQSVSDVVYDVYRVAGEDMEVLSEDQKETFFEEEFETDQLVAVKYAVCAKNKVGESPEAISNTLFIGSALEIPTTFMFNDEGCLDLFGIIDANEDGTTWLYDDDDELVGISYNTQAPKDDWLITPPLTLKGGVKYEFIMNAAAANGGMYPERFEVKAGADPSIDGMTAEVIASTDITDSEYNEYKGTFTPEADGTYYFGVHATSDADMYNIYVKNIEINLYPADEAPAVIADLDVVPGDNGAKSAQVLFTAPAKSVAGEDLTENLTKIEVYRDDALVGTLEDIAPGAECTFVDADETIESGYHSYYVVAYNSFGKGIKSDKVTVYIGVDIPAAVDDFAGIDNGSSMKFTWSKVGEEGYYGGYVNPADVDYNVYSCEVFWIWLFPDELIGTVRDGNELVTEMGTMEGEQEYKYFEVLPTNEAGESESNFVSMLVGKPTELPVEEPFIQAAGLQTNFFSEASDDGYDYTTTFEWDADGESMLVTGTEADAWGMFGPGRITLQGSENPAFMIDLKGGGATVPVALYVELPGGRYETVETTQVESTEFKTFSFDLSKYKDELFVIPWIYFSFPNPGSVNVKNLMILDQLDYNLTASMEAPKSVMAGQEAVVKLNVRNLGMNEAKGYTVKLLADEKELELNQTEMPAIPSMGSTSFTATFAPTVFDKGGDVTLKAEVVYDLDLNESNNIDERIITVKMPTVAGPENVKLDGETVSWTAPANNVSEYTETFENQDVFEPFSLGGITATNPKGALGGWTLYDGDGMEVYGFSGLSVPNLGPQQAAIVMDGAQLYTDPTGFANSGNTILGSFCPGSSTVPADDWIISPAQLGAQTLKFFVRQASSTDPSASSYYGYETFEVLYSTTDTEVASFTKLGDYKVESDDWTEISVDLPEDTKYFAIHHTSLDIFALYIDDVTYLAGAGEIVGYNIYVDQEQVGSVEGNVLSFAIAGLSGAHEIAVTAVYADGIESLPVYVTSEAKGMNEFTAIESILSKNEPFDVYTLNGVQVRKQTRSIEGLKAGVYVVNGLKVIIK